jgi:hypothetical protein
VTGGRRTAALAFETRQFRLNDGSDLLRHHLLHVEDALQ